MMSEKIDRKIDRLIQYGTAAELLPGSERIYAINLILDLLNLKEYDGLYVCDEALEKRMEQGEYGACLEGTLAGLLDYAVQKGVIRDTQAQRDIFGTRLMNCLVARPHEVIRKFYRYYKESPKQATDWFYKFSMDTDYIRRYRLAKDVRWRVDTEYGEMEILISLSKPEKDPRDIARTARRASVDYPLCALCRENEGFAGDASHAPRQNHRVIPLELGGEGCSFQYSPYGYFNEHCIVLNNRHIPMVIDRAVFWKLADFVDLFPHYFIGSNADLPYVGGSILSHEHFQGGCYELPVMRARVQSRFSVSRYPRTQCGILHWPVSTIRLAGPSREEIVDLSARILDAWKDYEDREAGIIAYTDGERHNTITPLLRKTGKDYEMYLMLRNNRTSKERPYGIFHTRPQLHHIKKEGIGIIDAPGLAILPSRLERELAMLCDIMAQGKRTEETEELKKHREWAEMIRGKYSWGSREELEKILRKEVGCAFQNMLEDAGVFKGDEKGKEAFGRFVRTLSGELPVEA